MFPTYLKFLLVFIVELEHTEGVSVTFKDRYLAGHIFAVSYPNDWLKCSLACQEITNCISYNFNLVSGGCELNEHGLRKDFKPEDQLTKAKDFVFHQIRPVIKDILPPKRIIDNQCDCNCASQSACTPTPDVNNKYLPFSCKDLWKKNRPKSGAYDIRSDDASGKVRLFCEMSNRCGDGGWTLVMKINGSKNTFAYGSSLWTNKKTFNPENGYGLFQQETKLASYWLTPMTKICLGMKYGGTTNWITVSQSGTSLYDVMKDGILKKVEETVDIWTSLLPNSSIETGCSLKGFNVDTGHDGAARARIGIVGFPSNCSAPSTSRLGFGTSGALHGMVDKNSCGNEERSKQSLEAFGYVLVQ